MGRIADFLRAVTAIAFAASAGALPSCGGGDETGAASESQRWLEGVRVSSREEALQIVAHGVVAPLYFSELAHAALTRAFEPRTSARSAALEGTAIDIEVADNAQGVVLRGELGFVRAVLRFDRAALGATARVDGTIVLEVLRTAGASGPVRRSQADALSISDGSRTLRWSYLDVKVDAQQALPSLVVVSDVPVGEAGSVWLDASSSALPGRYVAAGVIGFLKSRLTLQVAADGGWTIAVDNDKDDRVDFVVHASADEARALMPGL